MSHQNQYNILRFAHLDSTNHKLKSLLLEQSIDEYTVAVCSEQTAGKGQAGNHWESEAKKNLTFSLLLKPTYIQIQEQFVISKAVALGILEVFNTYWQAFTIKWPNDIYYQDKKIGGILIENTICQNVISNSIIGIGLNINQTTFVSDAPNPISLKNITGKDTDLNAVLEQILQSILKYIQAIKSGDSGDLDTLYMNNLYRKEGLHPYKDTHGVFDAHICGINEYGHLQLETSTGERRSYAFKEVEFINPSR